VVRVRKMKCKQRRLIHITARTDQSLIWGLAGHVRVGSVPQHQLKRRIHARLGLSSQSHNYLVVMKMLHARARPRRHLYSNVHQDIQPMGMFAVEHLLPPTVGRAQAVIPEVAVPAIVRLQLQTGGLVLADIRALEAPATERSRLQIPGRARQGGQRVVVAVAAH
jgi:hypothetical protein